eukprot:661791-Amphidinium_carterae.3
MELQQVAPPRMPDKLLEPLLRANAGDSAFLAGAWAKKRRCRQASCVGGSGSKELAKIGVQVASGVCIAMLASSSV